jgi:uncharacterized protein
MIPGYMRLKLLTLVILVLGASIPSQGQNKPTPKSSKKTAATKPRPAKGLEKTLLWEISGKALKKPSYLFGTMHVLCPEDAKISDGLKQSINASEQIVFEIDMDDMQQMMSSIKFLRMNDGIKVSDLLTEEEYARVKKYFDENKTTLPFNMLNRFKPYLISGMISEGMMNCEKTNGMEQQIMGEAGDREIFGLETIEFQSSIFDSIPYKKQARDLVQYVDSIEHYRKITMDMVEVYRSQDLEKMQKLVEESDPGMSQYMDLMLYARNRNWIDKMQSFMYEKPTLFAVGAGHLPGSQGVIELLKKAGYKVRPLVN